MLCESKGNLQSSFELTYETKRQLTLIGLALRRFAAGIDYMIILPSVFFYLESFHTKFYFLGLVVAADSMVAFFLTPCLAKLADKWRRIRFLGFVANLLQIGGSLIYALPLKFHMPLVGRLVSGLGQSFGGALYGEVKRVTTPEERNRVLIFMEGVRLFGVVIGPGMNFFVKNFRLTFGPWVIDQRTAPGFFMAIVWLLVHVVHVFTVFDLSRDPRAYRELPEHDFQDERLAFQEKPTVDSSSAKRFEANVNSDNDDDDDDDDGGGGGGGGGDGDDGGDDDSITDDRNESPKRHSGGRMSRPVSQETMPKTGSAQELVQQSHSLRELLCRQDVMLILTCQFVMFFNQTAFETLILLVGIHQLGFNINILSFVFICAGVEMVTVIIVVWSANKALDAKYLLITSLSTGIVASFARLAISFTEHNTTGCLVMTILMGFFTIIGTPIASIAGKSLLPKLTQPETHSFYQGAFATAQHLGLVVGPLLASVLYTHLIIFSSITIAAFLVLYILLLPTVEKMNFPAHGCGA